MDAAHAAWNVEAWGVVTHVTEACWSTCRDRCVATHGFQPCSKTCGRGCVSVHESVPCFRTCVPRVSPRIRPEECGLTHSWSRGISLLASDFYKYPTPPFSFRHPIPHQSKYKTCLEREREWMKVVDSRVWLILKTNTLPRRLVLSNRQFYTIVRRKLCPNQSVQASQYLIWSRGRAVLREISSTGSDQSKFWSSILLREVRKTVQKLKKILSEFRSVRPGLSVSTWSSRGSVQVEISSVQSSQVVPRVLAKSSPINQLLLA